MVALPERISTSPDEREWSRAGAGRTDRNAHAHAKTQADREDGGGPAVPWRTRPDASPHGGSARPFGRANRHHESRRFADRHMDVRFVAELDVAECRSRGRARRLAVAS